MSFHGDFHRSSICIDSTLVFNLKNVLRGWPQMFKCKELPHEEVCIHFEIEKKKKAILGLFTLCSRMCVIIIDSTLFPYECMRAGYGNRGVFVKATFVVLCQWWRRNLGDSGIFFLLLRRLIASVDKDKSFSCHPGCLGQPSTCFRNICYRNAFSVCQKMHYVNTETF